MHYTDFTRYCETALQEMYAFHFLPSLPHIVQKDNVTIEIGLPSTPYIAYATNWKNSTAFGTFMIHMHYDILISCFRKVVFCEPSPNYVVDIQRLTPNTTTYSHTASQYDASLCTINALFCKNTYSSEVEDLGHTNTFTHTTIQPPLTHLTISYMASLDPHPPLYYLEEFLGEFTNIVSAKIRALHAQEFPQDLITGNPPYHTKQPPFHPHIVYVEGTEFSFYCSYTWDTA